jgi:RNA polymerase sigma-70 factor (ECF subfamily)
MANVPESGATQGPVAQPPARPRRQQEDEQALVRRAQQGDAGAFEELVARNQQRVFAVVGGILRRREDTEDVAQQVFIKAYFSIKRFDMRSAFSTWLYKIAVNECWDYLRKKRIRPLVYEADLGEDQVRQLDAFVNAGQAPADASRRAELREIVEGLLSQLSDVDRQMLVLKEVEGFSVEEISEMLDLNVNTVKVRMFRARARLMRTYRQRFGDARRTRAAEKRG